MKIVSRDELGYIDLTLGYSVGADARASSLIATFDIKPFAGQVLTWVPLETLKAFAAEFRTFERGGSDRAELSITIPDEYRLTFTRFEEEGLIILEYTFGFWIWTSGPRKIDQRAQGGLDLHPDVIPGIARSLEEMVVEAQAAIEKWDREQTVQA